LTGRLLVAAAMILAFIAAAPVDAAARKKRCAPRRVEPPAVVYRGSGHLISSRQLARLEREYAARWARPMPITARGMSKTHRLLGFDHAGRVDVGLRPASAEGAWLRLWLRKRAIPYIAFRRAVQGQATGPHIHIGPGSGRLAKEVAE